jgi:hypothetical protein
MGVLKSPRPGVLQLCETITSGLNLWLGRGLNQSCSPRWELSNGMSHTTYTQGNRVDSRLPVVGSQIANLTPDLSFGHNLCCRCPNGSCELILDIYNSIAFNDINNALMRGVLTLAFELWTFKSPVGLPSPHFGNVSLILTLSQSRVVTVMH